MTIAYRVNPAVTNAELDELYLVSWPNHHPPYDFRPELEHGLAFVGAAGTLGRIVSVSPSLRNPRIASSPTRYIQLADPVYHVHPPRPR